jgi:hypothetical protein
MAGMNELPASEPKVDTSTDDPFEKHINIALEAQDGPQNTENNEDAGATSGNEAKPKEGETPKPEDSNSSTGDNATQQQPNKEAGKDAQPAHSPKDLKLPDGTVVKGGPERRFYEQREIARQQLSREQDLHRATTERAERAEASLQQLQQTTQALHGMDPNALRVGAAIVSDLQRDPVGTLKKLLAETAAQGYKLDDIGVGVDTLALQRMLDERLPQRQEQEQSDAEIEAEAVQEVTNFYLRHADARPHDAVLGRMLRDNPGLDLETAYYELKNAFAEKGFDFSRSLQDNLGVTSSQNNTAEQQQPNPQKPMPNGRTATENITDVGEVKVAHEDTDMSDIIKAAMRENGMSV